MPTIGPWAKRKYYFLGRYLEMFSTGMKNRWPERHYVDLFAGAGFAAIKGSREIVAGTPVLAANVTTPFTGLHLCDVSEENIKALRARIGEGAPGRVVHYYCGDSNALAADMLRKIPPGALAVTVADPYGLHLDFETVREVARVRSDLVVLLADNMDALRNWKTYYDRNPDSTLDRFMGDSRWRLAFDGASPKRRAEVLRDMYVERLKSVGLVHCEPERVQNTRGRDIYVLLLASRSEKALDFWRKARRKDEGGQRGFDFR